MFASNFILVPESNILACGDMFSIPAKQPQLSATFSRLANEYQIVEWIILSLLERAKKL